MMSNWPTLCALMALSLSTAACDRGKTDAELAALDRNLADAADPAITAALEDPIMTDPDLSVSDDSRRIRTVNGPAQAIYPPRSANNEGALSALDGLGRGGNACDRNFAYGNEWAERLPAEFPLYPGARLIEAAGNDRGNCRVRVIAFRTAATPQAILDWYRERAVRGGYSAEQQRRGSDTVLGGERAADDASYYLVVSPGPRTSEVALLTDRGR